jgi:hypothetical protein
MFDPQQIRLQVQRGEIPAHWRLIRGSASFAIRDYLKFTALPQFLGWIVLAGAFVGWISFFDHSVSPNFTFLGLYTLIYLLTPIAGAFIRGNIARNAALILQPEGCLVLTSMNDNAYTCKGLWYATIADMQLHISFWRGPYLAIKYYDGAKKRWYPSSFFGRRARTLQDVLTDYTRYQVTRSAYLYHPS